MSAWFCPACQEQFERDKVGTLSFDMRDPAARPAVGRCWSCDARRLTAVPDPDEQKPEELP